MLTPKHPEDYRAILDDLQRALWRRDQDNAVGMLDEISFDCNLVQASLAARAKRRDRFA